MGDQVGVEVSGSLYYVPQEHFKELLDSDLNKQEIAHIFANLCRLNALYMIARSGSGHIGSSFSSLDIMSWIYLSRIDENKESPNIFFSSKGHDAPGLYSVLIALGKLDFELLHKLRKIDGLPGHPDVATPNIVTNTGSLGMGISKAKGMVLSNRLKDKESDIYVLTGDGELQEGQFWESLISAKNKSMHEITVIVDHNKLQSDTLVSKVSDLGDLEYKFQSFGWNVLRCDGNNISEFAETLAESDLIKDKPKVIIADTIKGKGVSFMEHTSIDSDVELYKFHSGAPSEEMYTKAYEELLSSITMSIDSAGIRRILPKKIDRPIIKASEKTDRLVPAYTEALLSQARNNKNIIAFDADLILDTGLILFESEFPDRFIECGIAEQDMVSQAGGAALNGFLPVVHSFACFLTARPNEQIYNNSTEKTKIIYVGTLAGVVPGGPGHSHQGVRDISSMSAMPGLTIVEPSCESEVPKLLDWAINTNEESTYLRLNSLPNVMNFQLSDDYRPEVGKGVVIKEGKEILIFSYGPQMLNNAVETALKLEEEIDLKVGVVNLPWLNKIDEVWLIDLLESVEHVFCIDNHYSIGGQGDRLAAVIAQAKNLETRLTKIALNEIPVCGTNDEIMSYHGFDIPGLIHQIKKSINK